jgi:hypothetical protein
MHEAVNLIFQADTRARLNHHFNSRAQLAIDKDTFSFDGPLCTALRWKLAEEAQGVFEDGLLGDEYASETGGYRHRRRRGVLRRRQARRAEEARDLKNRPSLEWSRDVKWVPDRWPP